MEETLIAVIETLLKNKHRLDEVSFSENHLGISFKPESRNKSKTK